MQIFNIYQGRGIDMKLLHQEGSLAINLKLQEGEHWWNQLKVHHLQEITISKCRRPTGPW
jgi:hypothetical protein